MKIESKCRSKNEDKSTRQSESESKSVVNCKSTSWNRSGVKAESENGSTTEVTLKENTGGSESQCEGRSRKV